MGPAFTVTAEDNNIKPLLLATSPSQWQWSSQYGEWQCSLPDWRRKDAEISQLGFALTTPQIQPQNFANDFEPLQEPKFHFSGPRDNVETLETRRAQLDDARFKLLGARVRLESKRQVLQLHRRETGYLEGSFMEAINRFLLNIGQKLPADLHGVFEKVNEHRNEHGIMEFEYDEAEKDYNVREWEYTEKETAFMCDLDLADLVIQSTTPRISRHQDNNNTVSLATATSSSMEELDSMSLQAECSRESVLIVPSVSGGSKTEEIEVLTSFALAAPLPEETFQSHLDLPEAGQILDEEYILRPVSLEVDPGKQLVPDMFLPDSLDPLLRGLPHAQQSWLKTRYRVEIWLLETLRCSPFQKAFLKGFTNEMALNDKDWWSQVQSHWVEDDVESSSHDWEILGRRSSVAISTRTIKGDDVTSPRLQERIPIPKLNLKAAANEGGNRTNLTHRKSAPELRNANGSSIDDRAMDTTQTKISRRVMDRLSQRSDVPLVNSLDRGAAIFEQASAQSVQRYRAISEPKHFDHQKTTIWTGISETIILTF